MTAVPGDRTYTTDHEWLAFADGLATVGITSYAAEQLGDVVFVALPKAGTRVEAGRACGEIESTKAVTELYSPIDGEVAATNEAVVTDPSLINSDPYQAGWLFTVHMRREPSGLLAPEEYARHAGLAQDEPS